jgi:hypothetical protein
MYVCVCVCVCVCKTLYMSEHLKIPATLEIFNMISEKLKKKIQNRCAYVTRFYRYKVKQYAIS